MNMTLIVLQGASYEASLPLTYTRKQVAQRGQSCGVQPILVKYVTNPRISQGERSFCVPYSLLLVKVRAGSLEQLEIRYYKCPGQKKVEPSLCFFGRKQGTELIHYISHLQSPTSVISRVHMPSLKSCFSSTDISLSSLYHRIWVSFLIFATQKKNYNYTS